MTATSRWTRATIIYRGAGSVHAYSADRRATACGLPRTAGMIPTTNVASVANIDCKRCQQRLQGRHG